MALALLALNDHWWKGVGPGWLTGKLSDFAGLFYFPFLVIIVAGLVWRHRTNHNLTLGRFVFWGVGIWFAAAKSIPIVHAATVGFAESLLGDVSVVRDPSDAVAVIALLPAWLLYRHLASRPLGSLRQRFQPAVLGVAVLLTAATSKPRTPSVNRLITHEGQLYAVVGDEPAFDDEGGQVLSTSDGMTWAKAELSKEVIKAHKHKVALSINEGTFRLNGRTVEAAKGQRTTWAIEEDRQQFMKVAGGDLWSAVDIAALPQVPTTIVVALSTEGVVVRSGDGKWTRHGVGPAQPTPEKASFDHAVGLVLRGQWVFGAAATLIAWVLMSFLAWCAGPRSSVPVAQSSDGVALAARLRAVASAPFRLLGRIELDGRYLGAAIAGLVLPCLLFALYLVPLRVVDANALLPPALLSVLAVPFLAISMLPIALGWKRFNKAHPHANKRTHLRAAIAGGVSALAMLVFWDVGWIPSLAASFALAIGAIVATVWVRAAKLGGGSI